MISQLLLVRNRGTAGLRVSQETAFVVSAAAAIISRLDSEGELPSRSTCVVMAGFGSSLSGG